MASSANRHTDEHDHAYTMLQGFEWYTEGQGKHWGWLADNAKRFADMGITAVWLPPPCKTEARESTGYDIYDVWDLGEFVHPRDKDQQEPPERTKYGTRKQLEQCIDALRQNGIAIYIDAVLNHKMGADGTQTFKVVEVDANDRTKTISKQPFDIEGWTEFTFPSRNGKYSDFKWTFDHFTGVDWDQRGERKGIFKIEGDNKGWAPDVDSENKNYDYLMGADVEHAHPAVKDDYLKWGEWMVKTFPISGFRFDAVKHISRHFIHDFVKHTREVARQKRTEMKRPPVDESEGPISFAVGEFWKDSVEACLDYLGKFGDEQFSLFDAPLHYNFKEASDAGESYDLRKIFDGTIVQKRPIDAVTLVENHDTQAGQSLASPVSQTFKPLAYSIILLRQDGYPCVFLADLDGSKGDDHQPATEAVADLDKIIKARRHFAHGEQRDYWDHPQCVGWTRVGDESKPGCAVVLCIGSKEGRKKMQTKAAKGDIWVDLLGWTQGEVEIGNDGWAEFRAPAQSCSIWASKDAKEQNGF